MSPRGKMSDVRKGLLYMLLSAAGLSFFGLFIKLGTESISFFLLAFLRFLVPFCLILPYVLWKVGIPKFAQVGHFHLQLGRVGCLLVYQYAIFYYLTQASLLDATVLQNATPLFIPLLERVFMGHALKKRSIIGLLISFIGVLCILRPDQGIIGWVSLIGLIAALGQAGSQLFFGLQSRAERAETSLFYLFLISSVISLIIFFIAAPFEQGVDFEVQSLKQVNGKFYWCLLGLGLATIFNQTLRNIAYRYARPGILAPALYFSVIVSGILDWVLLNHLPNLLTIIGAILVILGGVIPFIRRTIEEHH